VSKATDRILFNFLKYLCSNHACIAIRFRKVKNDFKDWSESFLAFSPKAKKLKWIWQFFWLVSLFEPSHPSCPDERNMNSGKEFKKHL
jgi:hypothetical protein